MPENTDNIELRSEKVRNIIGQIPPGIIRRGISVLFIVMIGLVTGSYFFEYNYSIDTIATIEQKDDNTLIKVKIPANEIGKVKIGHTVILTFDNVRNLYRKRVVVKIQETPKTIQITGNKGYFIAEIKLSGKAETTENETIELLERTEVKAEIITDKISFFNRIIEPFKNIMRAKK